MMSIRKALARAALALCFAVPSGLAQAAAPYHVGLVTGTVSQSEDEVRAAEYLIKTFGDVKNGGYIQHLTFPTTSTPSRRPPSPSWSPWPTIPS